MNVNVIGRVKYVDCTGAMGTGEGNLYLNFTLTLRFGERYVVSSLTVSSVLVSVLHIRQISSYQSLKHPDEFNLLS